MRQVWRMCLCKKLIVLFTQIEREKKYVPSNEQIVLTWYPVKSHGSTVTAVNIYFVRYMDESSQKSSYLFILRLRSRC